ncbi:hypothetical protein [Escherichia coli]|uniref:hypothetical protein n=1 Tax=Escherichia coli TaxID=562 RepID=UPI003EED947E
MAASIFALLSGAVVNAALQPVDFGRRLFTIALAMAGAVAFMAAAFVGWMVVHINVMKLWLGVRTQQVVLRARWRFNAPASAASPYRHLYLLFASGWQAQDELA